MQTILVIECLVIVLSLAAGLCVADETHAKWPYLTAAGVMHVFIWGGLMAMAALVA